MALVSVVIPCYNQGRFLGDAIASVLATARTDYEIVVVDDGSTDDTAALAASFIRTRCIGGPNRGLANARNRGLAASTGRFVVFLDADDMLTPSAIDVGLAEMAARPGLALVSGRCRMMAADGTPLPTPEQPRVERDHYRHLLRHNYIWMPGMAMLRRDAVERVGGFDPSVNAAADYGLYLRIARDHPVHDHGQTVAWYRRHGGNMSGNAARMLQETLTVLRRERPFVENDRELLEAYYQGWQGWMDLYGTQLVEEIRGDVRSRRWPRAARKAVTLGWLDPRALAVQATRKLAATVGRPLTGSRRPRTRNGPRGSGPVPPSGDETRGDR